MKKRLITLLLTATMLLSAASACFIGASANSANTIDAGDAEFTVGNGNITEFFKGSAESGYFFNVKSEGTAQLVTKEKYPIAKLTFDLGLNASGGYGFFGISKTDTVIADPRVSDSENISFIYKTVGTQGEAVEISMLKEGNELCIARIPAYGNDLLRDTAIVNIAFVKSGGHWYLSLNGVVCNNIEKNFAAAQLDGYFGSAFFDKNSEGYIRFGVVTPEAQAMAIYFKPLTKFSNDWQVTADDTYAVTDTDGKTYERRSDGVTAETVQSAIPSVAVGTRDNGHIVDFTGTNGYAQSSVGFDLKTTAFEFSPIVTENYKKTFKLYFGFTSDTELLKDHSAKPGNMLEFQMTCTKGGVSVQVVTNSESGLAAPTTASKTSLVTKKTLNNTETNYKSNTVKASFTEQSGADGKKHWYISLTVGGTTTVYKGKTAAEDVYLQFDSIIDSRAYFRMGTVEKAESTLKIYCKASEWPEDGGINDLTEEEIAKINAIQKKIDALATPNANNYKDIENEITAIRAETEELSEAAREFVDITKITELEPQIKALKALYEAGDWYVNDGVASYSGDKWIGYSFEAYKNGSYIATTTEDYDIEKYSLYWKGIQTPKAWFAFSLTTDIQSGLLPNASDETVAFILTPSANALVVQYWDPVKRVAEYICEEASERETVSTYSDFEYYNRSREHTFTMVKESGHWYLKIDDRVFNGKYFDTLDKYMEAHSGATKIRFAGYTGLSECTVNIKDPTVDDSIIPDELKDEVEAFEKKIEALGGIADITNSKLSEKEAAVDALLEEYEKLESKIKKYVTGKDMLDAIKKRIELMRSAKDYGDWYVTPDSVTYEKSDTDSYVFDDCQGEASFATTTTPYNLTEKGLQWLTISIKGGSWFAITFTSDYTANGALDSNVNDKVTFICTGSNSDIVVQYWDNEKRQAVMLQDELFGNAKYTGFDIYNPDKSHTFGMTKQSDGHWYLYIDNVIFNGKYYDKIDDFMERYSESAYIGFGAYVGFGQCGISIVDSEYSDGSVIIDASNVKGELTDAQKYLQLLEENYVKVWENDKATAEKVYNFWKTLDYRAQLEVEAVLMDDYYMWDIHDLIATYAPELYVTSIPGGVNTGSDELITGELPKTGDTDALKVAATAVSAMISVASLVLLIRYRKHYER